jgi:AcrR family transcriptional regulator
MSKGELTRQRIIETAAPIFNRRGYEGCSLQELMEATGLEKGGIYRHFENKEELAREAFRYAMGRAVKTRTDNLGEVHGGAVAKLHFIVRRFVEHPSPIEGGCPLMNTAVDADDGNTALKELAREGICMWRRRLMALVEEGRRNGEVRQDVVPRQIANVLIATLEGALVLSRLEGTKVPLRDAQKVLDAMLVGLLAAPVGVRRVVGKRRSAL